MWTQQTMAAWQIWPLTSKFTYHKPSVVYTENTGCESNNEFILITTSGGESGASLPFQTWVCSRCNPSSSHQTPLLPAPSAARWATPAPPARRRRQCTLMSYYWNSKYFTVIIHNYYSFWMTQSTWLWHFSVNTLQQRLVNTNSQRHDPISLALGTWNLCIMFEKSPRSFYYKTLAICQNHDYVGNLRIEWKPKLSS